MTDNYPIVLLWSDEDEAYIADVPDLRSGSAWGDTPEDAVREVMIARALWIEIAREHGTPLRDWRESKYPPEIAREAVKAKATA